LFFRQNRQLLRQKYAPMNGIGLHFFLEFGDLPEKPTSRPKLSIALEKFKPNLKKSTVLFTKNISGCLKNF